MKLKQIATLLFIVFVTFFSYSQNRVGRDVIETFKTGGVERVGEWVKPVKSDVDYSDIVSYYELFSMDDVTINNIIEAKSTKLEITFKFRGENLNLQLIKTDALDKDFKLLTQDGQVEYNPNTANAVYYHGIINGDVKSLAMVNFFDGEVEAILSDSKYGNITIGKIVKTKIYIVYQDAEFQIFNPNSCETPDYVDDGEVFQPNVTSGEMGSMNVESKCIKVYLEGSNRIYTTNQNSLQMTTNKLVGMFNNSRTLFYNDNINISLKTLKIWTIADPYGTPTTSSMGLGRFRNNVPVYDGDVAQLLDIAPGALGGVASGIATMCSTNNYAYSDINNTYGTVPTYSWSVSVITHEFGHLFGSPHTHACSWNGNNTAIDNCGSAAIPTGEGSSCKTTPSTLPSFEEKGTIMSYCHLVSAVGISFHNGFGPQPAQRMIERLNTNNCISCESICINSIYNIQYEAVGNNINITWEDTNQYSGYKVWFAESHTGMGNTIWYTTSTKSFTISNVPNNKLYRLRIKPICDDGEIYHRETFVASSVSCGGIVYDTGGANINYYTNENYTRTFVPTTGNKIKLTFQAFNLENGMDKMFIYDGANIDAPLIGVFTGTTLPQSITASDNNTSGKITIHFISDNTTTRAGYAIRVDCVPATAVQMFTYYRDQDGDGYGNPTVTISAPSLPNGYVTNNLDCDDNNPNINPNAVDIPFNNIDENCNGIVDETNLLTAKVQDNYCGIQLANMLGVLQADTQNVPSNTITKYRWKIEKSPSNIYYVETSTNTLNVSDNFDYGSSYKVSIMLYRNNVADGYYGEVCSFTTPQEIVMVIPSIECKDNDPRAVYAVYDPSYHKYRFLVESYDNNANLHSQIIVSESGNALKLIDIDNFVYGERTFSVKVSGYYVETDTWTDWSAPCEYTSDSIASIVNCSDTFEKGTRIYCEPRILTQEYVFRFIHLESGVISYSYSSNNWTMFGDINPYYSLAEYQISVAHVTNGNMSSFGEACVIISPEIAKDLPIEVIPQVSRHTFMVVVTSDSKTLTSSSTVNVRIYDMLGRMISSKDVLYGDLPNTAFGEHLPTGSYLFVVSANGEFVTRKIIKK